MAWRCVGAEMFIQVLEQQMLPSRQKSFSRDVPAYFNETMARHILHVLQHHGKYAPVYLQKNIKFISFNIKYVVFILFSIEYRSIRFCK